MKAANKYSHYGFTLYLSVTSMMIAIERLQLQASKYYAVTQMRFCAAEAQTPGVVPKLQHPSTVFLSI
jgi:hypothetical protein